MRVLGKIIAAIEDTLDSCNCIIRVVEALVLQINGNPAAVYKNSLLLAFSIKVSVERSHNIDTFLTIAHLLNLSLTSVVENATDLNGPHRPCLLELIKVGTL